MVQEAWDCVKYRKELISVIMVAVLWGGKKHIMACENGNGVPSGAIYSVTPESKNAEITALSYPNMMMSGVALLINFQHESEKFIKFKIINIVMRNETLLLKKEVVNLKRKIYKIEHILEEDYELSEWAINELANARLTPREKYIKHEQMIKEFVMK